MLPLGPGPIAAKDPLVPGNTGPWDAATDGSVRDTSRPATVTTGLGAVGIPGGHKEQQPGDVPYPYDPGGMGHGVLAGASADGPATNRGIQKTTRIMNLPSLSGAALDVMHHTKAEVANTGTRGTNRGKDSAAHRWQAEQEGGCAGQSRGSGALLTQQPCFNPDGRDNSGGGARRDAHVGTATHPFDPGGGTRQRKSRNGMGQRTGADTWVVAERPEGRE